MPDHYKSSDFIKSVATGAPAGPPMIGALLRVPLEAVQRHMLARLHERGFGDLDSAHLNVFQYPGPQGARPSDLAVRLRVSKQALNYLLGALERLDYLERQPHPEDQRAKRIVLTDRGVAIVGVIRDAVAEMEDEWTKQLGEQRFGQLRDILADLNQRVEMGH